MKRPKTLNAALGVIKSLQAKLGKSSRPTSRKSSDEDKEDELEENEDEDEVEGEDEDEDVESETSEDEDDAESSDEDEDDEETPAGKASRKASSPKALRALLSKERKLSGRLSAALNKANATNATNAIRIAELEGKEQDLEKRASARAQQILAAGGHRPLNLGPDAGGGGEADNSHLKGRDRVKAAFDKEFSKK